MGLRLGENTVNIEVKDLTGKTSSLRRTVICDRLGPVISVEPQPARETAPDTYNIKVHAGDDNRLKSISMNGRLLTTYPVAAVMFTGSMKLTGKEDKAVITATDQAGNTTFAEIFPGGRPDLAGTGPGPEVLLASLTVPQDMLNAEAADGAGEAPSTETKVSAADSANRGGAAPSPASLQPQGGVETMR